MNSRERARKFRKIMNIIFDDEDEDDLVELLDSHAAEQREMCSKTCKTYINAAISTGELDNGIGQYVIDVVLEACLNATGESDG